MRTNKKIMVQQQWPDIDNLTPFPHCAPLENDKTNKVLRQEL